MFLREIPRLILSMDIQTATVILNTRDLNHFCVGDLELRVVLKISEFSTTITSEIAKLELTVLFHFKIYWQNTMFRCLTLQLPNLTDGFL